jgi:DNA-binding NtrC family response regulator
MDLMQLYQAALNASGIQVDGFTDPLKAYSRFQENSDNYDVIISDIRMPGLSGIQLAKKLKEIKKDVKVFLMSAYDMAGADSAILQEIELKEFLQKPFHMQQLVDMIEKHVGEQAIMNPSQISCRVN